MGDDLYLEIKDDYQAVQDFGVEQDYKDYRGNPLRNTIRLAVWRGDEVIAYLECHVMFNDAINESGESLVDFADGDLNDDGCEAMQILDGRGLLNRDESDSLFCLLATEPITTAYLQHVAVREDFRGKGIGGWLVRNLRDIIEINYKAAVGVTIVKIYPERITWRGESAPSFYPDLGDPDEDGEMFAVMRKLFEANGYVRHENSLFFIRDYAGDYSGGDEN